MHVFGPMNTQRVRLCAAGRIEHFIFTRAPIDGAALSLEDSKFGMRSGRATNGGAR